jgi:predicted MFS family arabinose efflux permease
MDAFVIAGLLPMISTELHASISATGQLVTVFTLCYAVASPLFATVLSGKQAKVILLAALAVFTAANAASAVAVSLPMLLVARAVAGIGAGLYSPMASTSAAHLMPAAQRGRALAVILGGLSVGTVLGVPLGLLLAQHSGWRATLWAITALGGIAMLGVLTLLPRLDPPIPPTLRQRVAIMIDRRVAPIVAVSFLANVASLGLYTYLAPVLHSAGGITNPTGYLWAWGLGGIVGAFGIGPLIDRTKRPFALMTVILIGFTVAILLVPVTASIGLLVVIPLAVWGAAGFASPPPQQHQLLDVEPEHGPVAVALNASAIYLGSAVGSGLNGGLLRAGLGLTWLPVVAAAVALVGLLVHLTLVHARPRPGRAVEPDGVEPVR